MWNSMYMFYNMYTPLYTYTSTSMHPFGFGCFSKHVLQFSNAERNFRNESSKGSNDHAFLRAPNGAHLGPVSQAARQPRSGTSHAEWFSAQVESQRFAEARELVATWQGATKNGGEQRKNRLMKNGKALRFYTHTNLTHPEIDSWQPFLLGCFFFICFLLMGLSLRCSFKNRFS